ncbi:MAG: radical SAM family heme chaperone HemW [Gemmatimonadota bacterium]
MSGLSLYIHAPFCARRCCYCDFAVTVDRAPDAIAWLDAVERELAGTIERERLGRPRLLTLYLGGGTPSLLGPGALPRLRDRLERHADIADGAEWTAEANPESFSAALAADWRAAGVNRLSFGAQSFDPAVLRWMGRLHGPAGPARAVQTARNAGFDNLSLDLIFGLPARLGRDWAADLERALSLGPDHISLYGLTAESRTPLGRRVAAGEERLADEEAYGAEYLLAADVLAAAGLRHYEVSNFARPDRESRHNVAYWTMRPYLGLGPGAHSYVPPRRWWNERDWAGYREKVTAGGSAVEAEEVVGDSASALERSWLGLRTTEGVDAGTEARVRLGRTWASNGWATLEHGRLRLTPLGWLLLDRLAVEYDAAA